MAAGSDRTTDRFRPEQGALFDLSSRTKLRLTGLDRLRYLNGQASNDVRKASETNAIHACVLNAKGKIDAEVFIAAEGDTFLVDSDAERAQELAARLERYIIADDVQVEDVTEDFALFHIVGPNAASLSEGRQFRKTARFGMVGIDVWIERADHERAVQEFSQAFRFCDDECAEKFRIERGLPRWGRELTDSIIPTEANLEASAIDFAKGCYIGQEVISRIKMSGQTNKRLCGLLPDSPTLVRPGWRLMSPDEEKDVGWITSAVMSDQLGKQIALGFVKRGFQAPGNRLTIGLEEGGAVKPPVSVTIAPLPFV